MSKIETLLCFGDRPETIKSLQQNSCLHVSWQKSHKEFINAIKRQQPAVIAITIGFKRSSLRIAREVIQHTKGNIPLFLIVDSSITKDHEFAQLAAKANVDYALTQSRPAELDQRLKVLLLSYTIGTPKKDLKRRLPGTNQATDGLYDMTSHRLNARKIADLFGVTLRQFSSFLGALPQSVHKTPDAVRLQPKLQVFERIARGLILVDNDVGSFRRWLNAPNSELDNHSPLEIIRVGQAKVVANLVEDALLGHPA